MKHSKLLPIILGILILSFSACESEQERIAKEQQAERERVELAQQRQREDQARQERQERERAERQAREEQERIERQEREAEERAKQAIYNKYINNSLRTGSTPYSYCYGRNKSCSGWGCSQIKIKTPYNSDVLATIKKNGKVYRHAYIQANSSHTFEMPDGRYQAFFYYGKGWNPDKFMKEATCGDLKGGFLEAEHFDKDDPQSLNNGILTYELILQQNGNFNTKPSTPEEAL